MSEELCVGVKMLLERMQTNPDDFEYGGKLYEYTNMIGELFESPKGHQRLWYMTAAEKKELMGAYTDMQRAKFTAGVVQSVLTSKPEYNINVDMGYKEAMRLDASGTLGIGVNPPSKMIFPKSFMNQAEDLLTDEYKKQYAKSNRSRP